MIKRLVNMRTAYNVNLDAFFVMRKPSHGDRL